MNNEIATQEITYTLWNILVKFLWLLAILFAILLIPLLFEFNPTVAKWVIGIFAYFVAQFAVGAIVGRVIRQREE